MGNFDLPSITEFGYPLTISTVPQGLKPGRINEEKLPTAYEIKSYAAENSGEYDMEPGVDYDDVSSFIVPKGNTYLISTELDWPYHGRNPNNGYNVDASCLVQVK